jgi:hypothetical protein
MDFVPGQAVKELTVLPIPDLHHPVRTRREESAVETERDGICRPELANGVARLCEHGPSVAVKSQTFTVRSAPREARCLPSG